MSVIVKPIISEKMSILEEKLGRYGFIVKDSANKTKHLANKSDWSEITQLLMQVRPLCLFWNGVC